MARKRDKRKEPRYRDASRTIAASFVFVAPLVAIYEVGVLLDERARNGADPIFRALFSRFTHLGVLFFNFFLLGVLFLAIWYTKSRRIRVPGLYARMFLESSFWAFVMLAFAWFFPPRHLMLTPYLRDLVASAGAGVYEEALFRLLLMGGLVLVVHHGLGGASTWVVPAAALVSALLFSQAHHTIGGEPFDRGVFLFRTAMGVLLGLLYWGRGLGIAVYTHTLYDVAIVTLRMLHDGSA